MKDDLDYCLALATAAEFREIAHRLEDENEHLQSDLRAIARYVVTHQDAIRDGNGMLELARMLDAAIARRE